MKGGEAVVTDEAFEQLVEKYQKLVYTVCYQMTKDPHTAEDLAQETFLSAYTHRDSCTPDTAKPWLCRIATNKAKDFLKSAYNRRVDLTDNDEDAQYNGSASPAHRGPGGRRGHAPRDRGADTGPERTLLTGLGALFSGAALGG